MRVGQAESYCFQKVIREGKMCQGQVNNLEDKVTYFRDECTDPGNLMVRQNSQGITEHFAFF